MSKKPWTHFLLIYALILVIITPLVGLSMDLYREGFSSRLKVLHLILFNHDDNGAYDKMQRTSHEFYKRFNSNVDTYYYCFSPKQSQPFILDDKSGILYIQGEESYAPGTLDKTIKVFHWAEEKLPKYDYVVRSNISTLVDFEELLPALENTPIEYGGGLINDLAWQDERSGVKDETYYGTKYASGTCIIFSTDCLKKVIAKSYLMNYNLVDDLAIGVFIQNHLPEIGYPVPIDRFYFVPNLDRSPDKIRAFVDENNPIFYRNHNGDRQLDADQLQVLTTII
jgi:hypothetical protein